MLFSKNSPGHLAENVMHFARVLRTAGMPVGSDRVHTALAALQALSRDRQANALRRWLRLAHGVAPSTAQLDELLDQIDACRTRGHRIHIKVAAGFVDRDGPRLTYTPSV